MARWRRDILRSHATALGAFIDVGANIGQTWNDVRRLNFRGPYVAFEPNPYSAAVLQTRIRCSRAQTYTRVFRAALADQAGPRTLLVRPFAPLDAAATLVAELRPRRRLRALQVACVRFDDIRSTLDIGRVSIVKIDVEGAECDVLAGMQNTLRMDRPIILCEVLDADRHASLSAHIEHLRSIEDLLNSCGYDISRVIRTRHGSDTEPISKFPVGVWTHCSRTACDYLFTPS